MKTKTCVCVAVACGLLFGGALPEWKGTSLAAWAKYGSQCRNLRVEDGVLKLETTGPDSQIYAAVPEPFEPRANQYVYLTAKVPYAGRGQVFWIPDGEKQASEARQVTFTFEGDDRFHTYRLRPLWSGRKINKLRIDFPSTMASGATAEVSEVRLVTEGEEIAVDTAVKKGVVFTLATAKAEYASLTWSADGAGTPGVYNFYTVPDGRPHTYWFDLREARSRNRGPQAWQGIVRAFFVESRHRGVELPAKDFQFVAERPDLPADPVITGVRTEEAIPRAGRPLALEVVVRNLGTRPAKNLRFAVTGLPAGVRVIDPSDLAPKYEIPGTEGVHSIWADWKPSLANEARFRIALSDPGVGAFTAKVALTADGVAAASVDMPVRVEPSLNLAKADYPPEPQPVDTRPYQIGAFAFPGWTFHQWHAIWTHALWRKPVLGWYDETNPEVIDWQIKHLVENGVGFLYVDWYWSRGSQHLNHWMEAFKQARYRKYMKWCVMWANHNGKGSHSIADQTKATQWWIDHFFNMPEYLTENGMPVVSIWSPRGMENDLGPGGCKKLLDHSRTLARRAGYKGIWFVAVRAPDGSEDPAFLEQYRTMGFDATCVYKYTGSGTPGRPALKDAGLPFEWVVKDSYRHWKALQANSPIPFLPSLSTAWDDRPWRGEDGWAITDITPAGYRRICADAKRFSDETGVRRLLMGPLDEWGEGSIAYPNAELGFGMLEAVRDTFGRKPANGWPINYAPIDVGLGPYPAPTVEPYRK